MGGVGRNRVFDSASIEELKGQTSRLLKSAESITEDLKSRMAELQAAAAAVPSRAKYIGLESAASRLAGSLDSEIYTQMETKLVRKLDELNAQIPACDSAAGTVLGALTATASTLTAMLEELRGMIQEGSLTLSLPEFTRQLGEYEKRWEETVSRLNGLTGYAMSYLKGLVLTSAYSKDPVNLSTGNFYYEKEDLYIKGGLPLVFKRCYNALDTATSALGEGWSHSGSDHISFMEGKAVLHKEDGREIPLEESKEGLCDAYSKNCLLTKEGNGYRSKEGRGTFLCFDAEGRLVKKEDRLGNRILYTHDEKGRILMARMCPAGAEETEETFPYLLYTYRDDGLLGSIKDHTGREVSFFYMEGKLMEVTAADGSITGYRYGENAKMRAVKNTEGTLGVKNEYDEKGRVVRQRFPDKGQMLYAYDDKTNTTTLTERNGAVITYVQDERLRNIKTVYHDSEESFVYNEKDRVVSSSDRNGNVTRYAYDDKGNVAMVINALGEKTHYTHDAQGRLLSVARCGKTILKNTYDKCGRLVKTEDGLMRTRECRYDGDGYLKSITGPDGSCMEFAHDERGNITCLTDPYGNTTHYGYDDLNRIVHTTDGNGNTTYYSYDNKDRLVKAVNAEGNVRSYRYNKSGKVTRVTDFDGSVTAITYNALNRPECLTDKEGRRTYRSYDRMWNVSREISPSGAVTCFTYDKDNRLERVELYEKEGEKAESVFSYTHDAAGNLIKTEAGDADTACSRTVYGYDALNRIISITDACGGKHGYTYDEQGHVSSVTDPAGNRTEYSYDAAGQKILEKDGFGNILSYEYDSLGRIKSITDRAGRKTIYEREPGGRLKAVLYPDGRSVSYTYDGNGNILTKKDEGGYTLTYTYDCMDRVREVMGSGGEKKSYTYDALGNVLSMTDAEGHTTRYEYTLSGKLKAVTDALLNRTEYTYDALDNLILVRRMGKEGEEERKTSYTRDVFGRMETMTDSLGMEENYRYDALGRMAEKTDRDGYITAYRYTPDGKTASILYGDGTGVEMEYDALRRLIRIKDALGITGIERNKDGSIASVTDHKGRITSYEWGMLGERKSMTYPDGRKVSYAYDSHMRLESMTLLGEDGSDRTIAYRYDALGRLAEKKLPEGMTTRWSYDGKGQPVQLLHEDKEGILDCYTYAYDRMGNKTSVTRQRRGLLQESGVYTYAYDALGRLSSVTKDGEALRDYTYDSFGNRTEMKDYRTGRKTACTYDAMDRLAVRKETIAEPAATEAAAMYEYSYDNRGNLIQESMDGSVLHDYVYGAINRLVRAEDRIHETKAQYRYNGLGQRTSKTVWNMADAAGMADSLHRDTESAWEEDYLLDLTKPYHNLIGIEKDRIRRNFYYDNNVTAMEENNLFYYYLQDEMGSPLRVSEKEGEKAYLTYGYDEFGNDLGKELEQAGIPNPYSRQGEGQPFGYTGYRYDRISDTYFAQAREYRPEMGRFTAEDVIKGNGLMPQTLNPYIYCWNNPLVLVDLDGLFPAWLNGIYAHLTFESEFMSLYDKSYGSNSIGSRYGKVNVYIPGGSVKGGPGYADVVLYDGKCVGIYEIKPQTYYENPVLKVVGERQLTKYVDAYSNEKGDKAVTSGNMKYVETLLFTSEQYIFNENKTIIYRMYEDSPGMIYYEIIDKENGEKAPILEMVASPKEVTEAEQVGMIAVFVSILSGMKTGAVAVVNGLFAPFVMCDEILEQSLKRINGCTHEEGKCSCVV